MTKRVNLLEGNISEALIKLALPIMGTSFIQMAYNMTDMIWIGRISSDAVAAVGTAGFYMWLSVGLILVSKLGAQVKVSQLLGGGNYKEAKKYARNALQMNFFFAVLYSLIIVTQADKLIDFFNVDDVYVVNQAVVYLTIVGLGNIFPFTNQAMTSIVTGTGNSKTPFIITTIGLIFNIILDPMLIFGIGPFSELGVKGAAIATVLSQGIVFLLYILYAVKDDYIFANFQLLKKPEINCLKQIVKIGMPTAVQSAMFTFFSMIIARIIADWGPLAIAVQKVGSQIESISWMTSDGFSSALNAFTGQNYGANKYDRVKRGYYTSIKIISIVGIAATLLLIFAAGPIFNIFIPEKEALPYGINYLRILGISQFFMCIEIVTQGSFYGLGKTIPPSIIGIIFNASRIPLALLLSKENILGLNGVWWSISITSILKGIILSIMLMYYIKNKLGQNEEHVLN